MWTATILDLDTGAVQSPKLMPPSGNGVRPKCYRRAAEIWAAPVLRERFRVKRRASRQKDASNQNLESRFDSIETKKALGMIQQVKIRQQMHGEIATKRSIAVAAITTDSGNLDHALI
jgi:hypothetical protein